MKTRNSCLHPKYHSRVSDTVRSLARLYRECEKSPKRFAYDAYLEAVYRFYAGLREDRIARKAGRWIARSRRTEPPKGTHVLRIIIDATCRRDIKTKSRWALALRYIWSELESPDEFQKFLKANGGIYGCAQTWSHEEPRYRQRYRKIGSGETLQMAIFSKRTEKERSEGKGVNIPRYRISRTVAWGLDRRDAAHFPNQPRTTSGLGIIPEPKLKP